MQVRGMVCTPPASPERRSHQIVYPQLHVFALRLGQSGLKTQTAIQPK